MIAMIDAIAEKKKSSTIAEIEKVLSQRSLSLRSLESGFHMIEAIAKPFFPSAIVAIMAIIWKPGFTSLLSIATVSKTLNMAACENPGPSRFPIYFRFSFFICVLLFCLCCAFLFAFSVFFYLRFLFSFAFSIFYLHFLFFYLRFLFFICVFYLFTCVFFFSFAFSFFYLRFLFCLCLSLLGHRTFIMSSSQAIVN